MKKLLMLLLATLTISPAFAQRDRRTQVERSSNDVIVSGISSQNKVFSDLLSRQSMLGQQIGVLSDELSNAKGGKARKISCQLEQFTADIAVVERLLATFPQNSDGATIETLDNSLQREIDSIASVRLAATDPFAGRISNDPELERMYREYLSQNGSIPQYNSQSQTYQQSANDGRVFRVMIAISKSPLPVSNFDGMQDVMEQKMPVGGVAYYQGAYDSVNEAQIACRDILAQRRFRDAFVVAMVGNRRVPLN